MHCAAFLKVKNLQENTVSYLGTIIWGVEGISTSIKRARTGYVGEGHGERCDGGAGILGTG